VFAPPWKGVNLTGGRLTFDAMRLHLARILAVSVQQIAKGILMPPISTGS
jgi:hypothetical protein